jgi:hypothetical protein
MPQINAKQVFCSRKFSSDFHDVSLEPSRYTHSAKQHLIEYMMVKSREKKKNNNNKKTTTTTKKKKKKKKKTIKKKKKKKNNNK